MQVIVHLPDMRYVGGRDVDITDFTVADAERLAGVWHGEVTVNFKAFPKHQPSRVLTGPTQTG